MKKSITDLATIEPKNLPELQGFREKQLKIVEENPFIEITDNASYEAAKKSRTALVTARTDIQKQDKVIASKLKDFRKKTSDFNQELIDITLPHEVKQQEEVKRYEAEKEAEKLRKEEEERKRVDGIKKIIDEFKEFALKNRSEMVFESIDLNINGVENFYQECISDFDFQEFLPLFEDAYENSMVLLNEKAKELHEKEAHRIENERLAKEAEEARKKQELQSERLDKLLPYHSFVPEGLPMSMLSDMNEESFKELLENTKRAKKKNDYEIAKKQQEEADRLKKIQEEEERLAEEKRFSEIKKQEENKISKRISQLTDLGLSFDFKDSYVSEINGKYVNVPILDIKTRSDDQFQKLVDEINVFLTPVEEIEVEAETVEPENFEKTETPVEEIDVDVEEVDFERNLPEFLIEDELGLVRIAFESHADVTEIWEEWLKENDIKL